MPDETLLKMPEVQRRLGIGYTKAAQLVLSGELASVKIGRARRVPAGELAAYVARLMAEAQS